jgi:hypothetical protein
MPKPDKKAIRGRAARLTEGAMTNSLSLLLADIFSDPIKLHAFQELCASGKIHAEGKPVRFEIKQNGAHVDVTHVIEPRFKWIPVEHFSELVMSYWGGELRLDGTLEHYTPELIYDFKA